MTNIVCPDCEENIEIPESAIPGDIVLCDTCAAEMLIKSVEPLSWKLIEEVK